jgi:hypothetical protein
MKVLPQVQAMPDRSAVAPKQRSAVGLLVDGWPDDVRECINALIKFAPQHPLVVVDLGNVDGAGEVVDELASQNEMTVFHIAQDLKTAGWAMARNAIIKAIPAEVHVIMDLSTVLDGDAISPLVDAISGDVVLSGWRGVNVNLEDEWRSFKDAETSGEVDAVLSYLMAVSREAALRTPIDLKSRFYRNADLEWSLSLRAQGGKVVMPAAELPCHQTRHRGYHDSDPEYREFESKKTYNRLLKSFRSKDQILAPRS